MALEWLPRDNDLRDHILIGSEHWGSEAPCTVYEKKPLTDPNGNPVEGLYVAWIRLNNPKQYNSYTTEMVKGVIAGFTAASQDRSVVATVFHRNRATELSARAETRKNTPNTMREGRMNTASTWICSTAWWMPF